jgi:hypothetical protein
MILVALGVSVALRTRANAHGRGGPARPNVVAMIVLGALLVQVIGVLTRPAGTMPVFRLSWLLALGGGALAAFALRPWSARAAFVGLALLFAWDHQIPRRVLVGDAGAILYESDRPGLDIIGLGGYHLLPFARAGVHGLPATLELLERVPDADKPDVLAIFPTWWGVLPVWFASDVLRRFPVEGNVICGGYEHVVYRADWHVLGTGDRIRSLPAGDTRVFAQVDIADLVSEQANAYVFDHPSNGWTDMRVLPDPTDSRRDMFDAGRRMAVGKSERWVARGLTAGVPAHLVIRTAPESKTHVRVRIDGVDAGAFDLERGAEWLEVALPVAADRIKSEIRIELTNDGPGDFVDFHEWLTQ